MVHGSTPSSEESLARRRTPRRLRCMDTFSSSDEEESNNRDHGISNPTKNMREKNHYQESQDTLLATQSQTPFLAKQQTPRPAKKRAVYGGRTPDGIPSIIQAHDTPGSIAMESMTQTTFLTVKPEDIDASTEAVLKDMTNVHKDTLIATKESTAARVSLSPEKPSLLFTKAPPRSNSTAQPMSSLEAIGDHSTKNDQNLPKKAKIKSRSSSSNVGMSMTQEALKAYKESKERTTLQIANHDQKTAAKKPPKSPIKRDIDCLVKDVEDIHSTKSKKSRTIEKATETATAKATPKSTSTENQKKATPTKEPALAPTIEENNNGAAKATTVSKTSSPNIEKSTTKKGKTGKAKAAAQDEGVEKAKVAVQSAKPSAEETAVPVKKVDESTRPAAKAPPPAPPKLKTKKRTFQDQVLAEMFFSCKPYTLKTLSQAVQTTEAALHHVMLTLLDKQIVVKKEVASSGGGRSKELYWVNQECKAKEMQGLLASPQEIGAATDELNKVQRQYTDLQKQIAVLAQELSNEEVDRQVQETETSLAETKKTILDVHTRIKATKLQPKKKVNPAQAAKERCPRRIKIRINNMRDEWKKRKAKCMEFIDQLADGMEKKPKDVIKLLALETDEMEGVVIPTKHEIE